VGRPGGAGGVVGQFLYQYGLTIVFSVSISLLVALTLTPMLASRFMRLGHRDQGWLRKIEKFHRQMAERYATLVAWAVEHSRLVILAAMGSLIIGGIFASMVPSTFLGEADRSEYLATVKLPLGSGIASARDAALRADAALREDDQIELVFITAGAGINGRTNRLEFYVETSPKRGRPVSQGELMNRARATLSDVIPEAVEISINEVPWVSGGGVSMNPIELVISGSDMNQISEYADALEQRLRADPSFADICSTYEGGRPEVQLKLDRARATDLGVSAREVAKATQIMLGGIEAGTFEEGGRRYDVRVRMEEELRQSLSDLGQLPVRSENGTLVDMALVTDIGVESGPTQIDRLNRARQVTIILNLPLGIALGDADARADEIVAEFPPPAALSIKKEGMARRLGDTSAAIISAFVLAIIALYIVLASQFDRFAQPVLIMLTAPLSFSGALFAMWAAGQQMSLFAQIGLLALMGIVMKNGILLVDRANQLCEEGLDAREAMLRAAPERLRPVLMTALAAVFGMIPVALTQSDGAEWRNPMGFIIIGGLTTSTLLTLVVIPAIYVGVAGLGTRVAGVLRNQTKLIANLLHLRSRSKLRDGL
jgi:hydrophobic/amphiphilic exporter-1 (mainly G- bacteria), HAE1 family